MAKVATWSPESPRDPAHTTILHSTEDERNVSQIGMLLQVREQSSQLLIQREEIGHQWNIDKDAQEDARKTFCLAGHVLRNILEHHSRWDLSQNEIDVKTAAVLDLKIRENQSRIEVNETLKAPSSFLRVQFRKIVLASGQLKWCCWLGGVEPHLLDVHGLGDTPEEAAKAFDVAYVTRATQPAPQPPVSETKPVKKTKKGTK